MRRIAIIAGTSESREIIDELGSQYEINAYVATELGAEMLKDAICKIHIGRLDFHGFKEELKQYDGVVDASHPFAVEVSKTVKNVCELLNIPYIRYKRKQESYNYENIIYVANKEEVVRVLNEKQERILFTTGSNTLPFYSENINDFEKRVIARVLDAPASHKLVERFGSIILIINPPISVKDNIDCINRYNIDVMVSKDSGERGGLFEKIQACKECDIPIILIRSPDENDGMQTIDELKSNLRQIKTQMKG